MPGARRETAPVTVDTPGYLARTVEMGDLMVAFETIRQEQESAPAFKGLPDDRCPCPHWGIIVSGRLTLRYRDHDETFEAGDVYYAPPGHLPRSEAGTQMITFSPKGEIKKVNAAIAENLALLARRAS